MIEKPLIKWIIGPVSDSGFQCLLESVTSFTSIYGSDFDYMICHNNLNIKQLEWLESNFGNFKLYDQIEFCRLKKNWPRPSKECGPAWKAFVPRFRINSHEITLDNDVYIRKKVSEITDFVKSENSFLISEAIQRSVGYYENLVSPDVNFNTGILGIPPGYDLPAFVEKLLENYGGWTSWFDEQGMLSYLIQNENYHLVRLSKIFVCYAGTGFGFGTCGEHWVGINSQEGYYWKKFYALHPSFIPVACRKFYCKINL